jgi:hypothetical protein
LISFQLVSDFSSNYQKLYNFQEKIFLSKEDAGCEQAITKTRQHTKFPISKKLFRM